MMIAGDDRGFTLGDGLFETVLADAGALVLWDRHMQRLARGCAALGLAAPEPGACRVAAAQALTDADLHAVRAAVRLSWSAGAGGRGLERPAALAPGLVVQAATAPRPTGPATLVTVAIRRNEASPVSRLKSLSYLDQVLARREALAAGADEALMLNTKGELACAAAANLFWLEGRALFTPALECGVLDGVVRAALIERAQAEGFEVHAVPAGPEALEAADAAFLTSSLIGVRAIAVLNGRRFEPHRAIAALTAMIDDLV